MNEKITEDDILSSLNKHFFHKTFRSDQVPIVRKTLDKTDVLVIKENGFGTSLCYQLPGLMREGIIVIVSPLLSRIETKCRDLDKYTSVKYAILNSSVTSNDSQVKSQDLRNILNKNNKVWEDMKDLKSSGLKFVFVTLEYFVKSYRLKTVLNEVYDKSLLQAIVIDKVECVAQWSYSFRQDYSSFGTLRDSYPNTSFLCFMGPVSKDKLSMVQETLHLKNPYILNNPSIRENISFKVMYLAEKLPFVKLVEFIKKTYNSKSGLIYCNKDEECTELTRILQNNNVESVCYSEIMADNEKFRSDYMKYGMIVVCTSGNAIDINLREVNFVIHTTLPSSLDIYIQESGKAGRNGNQGDCIIFYCNNNYDINVSCSADFYKEKLRRADGEMKKKLLAELKEVRREMFDVVVFAENISVCRQVFLLKYLNEDNTAIPCGVCDVCEIMELSYPIEMSPSMRKILMAIWTINRYQKDNLVNETFFYANVDNVIDLLLGNATRRFMDSRLVKEWFFGSFAAWEPQILQRLIFILLSERFLLANHISNGSTEVYQNLVITSAGQKFCTSTIEFHVTFSRKDVVFKKFFNVDWTTNQFKKDLESVLLYHSLHNNFCVFEWYKIYMSHLYQVIPGTWEEFKRIKFHYLQNKKCDIDEELFEVCLIYHQILRSNYCY